MATENEIAAKLASVGLGTVDTDIFAFKLPASPDTVIAVLPAGGIPPEMAMGALGIKFETPNVRIIVRGEPGADDAVAKARAQSAYAELSKVEAPQVLSVSGGTSAAYHWIHPQQPPFLIRRDENDRPEYGFNCLCEKELST